MEESTLLFRHLPAQLSVEERKDLLHYLGAKRVQVMGKSGAMKNTAFAVFPSKEEASKILKELHQVEFLGSTLKVEFACKAERQVPSVVDNEGTEDKTKDEDGDTKGDNEDEVVPEVEIKFDDTFKTWGLKHPRRPDLVYAYPPPTMSTLTNIMHTLAAVPKFYVQVLHLMNKMDLPAPFGPMTPAPPVRSDIRAYVVQDNIDQKEMDISSETESELSSDAEDADKRPKDAERENTARRRRLPHHQKLDRKRKRPRLSDLQYSLANFSQQPSDDHMKQSTGEATIPVSEVFDQRLAENTSAAYARKIEMKIPSKIAVASAGATSIPVGVPPPSSYQTHLPSSLPRSLHHLPSSLPHPLHPPLYQQNLYRTNISDGQVMPHGDNISNKAANHSRIQSGQIHESSSTNSGNFSSPLASQLVAQFGSVSEVEHHTRVMPPEQQVVSSVSAVHDQWINSSYNVPLPPSVAVRASHQQGKDGYDLLIDTHGSGRDGTSTATSNSGGFGIIEPTVKPMSSGDAATKEDEVEEKEWTKTKFISSSQLRKSRLSLSEMKECSVFRRYTEGEPSCRLYIKNLAKQVTEDDIHWIFGRYINWEDETEKNIFDVRLMKEGRMKGQAFVTLASEKVAVNALKDTNGFVLKDKPMVVQFARSAKAQEDEASKP